MGSHKPAPKNLVKAFLKSVKLFMKAHDFTTTKDQAEVCGVGVSTYRDWYSGRRKPTRETLARVSFDLAAIERFCRLTVRL
jgi:transcriptional regulator with XRE-family HTH domain